MTTIHVYSRRFLRAKRFENVAVAIRIRRHEARLVKITSNVSQHNGDLIKGSPQSPQYTIALWWSERFQGSPMMPTNASLSDSCTSDHCFGNFFLHQITEQRGRETLFLREVIKGTIVLRRWKQIAFLQQIINLCARAVGTASPKPPASWGPGPTPRNGRSATRRRIDQPTGYRVMQKILYP